MAEHLHKLEIFRGLIKFKSNQQKIWGVLIFLSIVTAIEVSLGILKPEILLNKFIGLKLINWLFVIMTIIKAYYITWDFMHIRDEKSFLKNSIVVPLLILIRQIEFRKLNEGSYIFDVMLGGFKSWNF
jgi:cytochrome c oxidase subunit IV